MYSYICQVNMSKIQNYIQGLPESVVLNKDNLKILTPNGYEDFLGVNKIVKDRYIHLKFSNGAELDCSEDHPLVTINGIVRAKDIDKKTLVEDHEHGCFVVSKRLVRKKIELYDIVNSGKDNIYYSNGIVSHNCEFLGSTNTLIEGSKLQQLYAKDVLEEIHGMEIYEYPVKEFIDEETQKLIDKDHIYVICADVSEGKNLDYTAFSVIDVSAIPYKQVATYRNNTIIPMLFPDVLKLCAEYYNNAWVLIEVNNNPQIADCLYLDLEYENVFKIFAGNKKGQVLSESGKASQNGLNMSPLVKRTGCSALKTLIETNKLQIDSSETIYELSRFIATNNSFAAEEGANDDLAMTLVMFGWLSTQKLFIDLSSTDIRKRLQIEHNYTKEEDHETPPDIQIVMGVPDKYILEDGDLWEIVDSVFF